MNNLQAMGPLLPDIRMRLHLDRIPDGAAHITTRRITERSVLGSIMSAYRRSRRRFETSLGNPFSKPMSVAEVGSKLPHFSPANRAAFEAYVDAIASTTAKPSWVVPAYDLGDGELFLLDGNHRAVATYLAARDFSLELVVLHGPVDRRILAPLKYWDGGLKRFRTHISC